jgi:hypothetical protein
VLVHRQLLERLDVRLRADKFSSGSFGRLEYPRDYSLHDRGEKRVVVREPRTCGPRRGSRACGRGDTAPTANPSAAAAATGERKTRSCRPRSETRLRVSLSASRRKPTAACSYTEAYGDYRQVGQFPRGNRGARIRIAAITATKPTSSLIAIQSPLLTPRRTA